MHRLLHIVVAGTRMVRPVGVDSELTFMTDELPVSERIFSALRRIIRAVDLHSRELSRRHGLTGPQALILSAVERQGPLTAGDLARRVSLSQASITDVVKRLERRGLLVRFRADTDRRQVLVMATDAGRGILRDAPPLLQETFVHRLQALPESQRQALADSLQQIASMMDLEDWSATPVTAAQPAVALLEDALATLAPVRTESDWPLG